MASPFSGRAGRLAGMWAIDQATKDQQNIADLLAKGQGNALDALGRGRDQGLASLGASYDAARPEYQGAIDRLNPWTDAGIGALGTYQDSLGLNGQEGYDNTVATYRTSPGYERRVSEASDAAMRAASAGGALGSGNTLAAVADRVQGIADDDYGRWQGQLQGLSDRGQQAAGTQAGIQTQLGNLNAQEGRDIANLWGTSAGQEASTFGNFAGLGANNIANTGQQVIGAGTGALMAGQNAAQNRLNFGMQMGKTAASLLAAIPTGGLSLAGLAA